MNVSEANAVFTILHALDDTERQPRPADIHEALTRLVGRAGRTLQVFVAGDEVDSALGRLIAQSSLERHPALAWCTVHGDEWAYVDWSTCADIDAEPGECVGRQLWLGAPIVEPVDIEVDS